MCAEKKTFLAFRLPFLLNLNFQKNIKKGIKSEVFIFNNADRYLIFYKNILLNKLIDYNAAFIKIKYF